MTVMHYVCVYGQGTHTDHNIKQSPTPQPHKSPDSQVLSHVSICMYLYIKTGLNIGSVSIHAYVCASSI